MRPRKGLGSGWSSSPVGRTRGGRRSCSLCSRASHTCVHVDQETPHLLKKETKQKHFQGMQMLLATNHPGSGKGLEC